MSEYFFLQRLLILQEVLFKIVIFFEPITTHSLTEMIDFATAVMIAFLVHFLVYFAMIFQTTIAVIKVYFSSK